MENRTEDTAQLQKVSKSDGERPLEKEQGLVPTIPPNRK